MNKFFALAIMADLSLKRIWMDSVMALHFLKENEGAKLYRVSTDQEAEIVIADPQDEIVWKDVSNQDYKVG